jgi:hypothetical protein
MPEEEAGGRRKEQAKAVVPADNADERQRDQGKRAVEGKAEEERALGDRAVESFSRAGTQPRACRGKAAETAVATTHLQGRGSRHDCGREVPGSRTPTSYDAARRT